MLAGYPSGASTEEAGRREARHLAATSARVVAHSTGAVRGARVRHRLRSGGTDPEDGNHPGVVPARRAVDAREPRSQAQSAASPNASSWQTPAASGSLRISEQRRVIPPDELRDSDILLAVQAQGAPGPYREAVISKAKGEPAQRR